MKIFDASGVKEVQALNQYEGMFLFDPTFASEGSRAKDEVMRILDRAGAEIVFLDLWEERKLAYEIKGRKRGCYMLSYFKCAGPKLAGIERDAQLSEPILRLLIKRAEGVTKEQIERFMPQARASEDERPGAGGRPPRGRRTGDDADDDEDVVAVAEHARRSRGPRASRRYEELSPLEEDSSE